MRVGVRDVAWRGELPAVSCRALAPVVQASVLASRKGGDGPARGTRETLGPGVHARVGGLCSGPLPSAGTPGLGIWRTRFAGPSPHWRLASTLAWTTGA